MGGIVDKVIAISGGVWIIVQDMQEAIEHSDGLFATKSKDSLYIFDCKEDGVYATRFTENRYQNRFISYKNAYILFGGL